MRQGWQIQSSAVATEGGKAISTPGYSPKGWVGCTVPSTVFNALVKAGEYENVYFSNNLEKITAERFQASWWYRNEFEIEGKQSDDGLLLRFLGLNYRANIWLNGELIADADTVENPFRIFNIDISKTARSGRNAIAVEVFPPKRGDLTIGFVDWNPPAPDNNMGLWRGVELIRSGSVSIAAPFVRTEVDTSTLKSARITIGLRLGNNSQRNRKALVRVGFEGVELSREVELAGSSSQLVAFNPSEFSQLLIENPRLWWPNGMGSPELYNLNLTVEVDGRVTDSQSLRFGIRSIQQFVNSNGHKGWMVNGKKVLIKGAGWVDDLTLADTDEKVKHQLEYVRHMNLNTIRLEGFWGSNEKIYDYADEYGILVMVGWSCQWEWEGYCGRPETYFMSINPHEYKLHTQSFVDQVTWLRNHPSVFLWVFGSDKLPPTELEAMLVEAIAKVDPTRPMLASCKYYDSSSNSRVSGSTGVKMVGPYEYVTPSYWYLDTQYGGAYGFNTETGPGAQVPPLESIKRMIPADSLWPPTNYAWRYHCGRGEFNSLARYIESFNGRYGESDNVVDFTRMAQVMNYEAIRPMFEAFEVNKFNSTGVIQWMLNSAWPEMFWQLYDWYLMPNGAFYGTRNACRPLNIVYNYGSRSIYLTSDLIESRPNLVAEVKVLSLDSKVVFSQRVETTANANSSRRLLALPRLANLSKTYFLDLRLLDGNQVVASNFYWLSTQEDVPDFKNSEWFVTPSKQFADLKGLRNLPKAAVDAHAQISLDGDRHVASVTLTNKSDRIAFGIELALVGGSTGETIFPVFWDDNYLSLLPNETRTLTGWVYARNAEGQNLLFRMSGINLENQ